MQRLLDGHGEDYSSWRSQPLTRELLESADLVLTATTRHRSEIAWSAPHALRRTFPVLQFAALCRRLSGGLPGTDARVDLDERLALVREGLRFERDTPDLTDPIGKPLRVFKRTDRLICEAADSILGLSGAA